MWAKFLSSICWIKSVILCVRTRLADSSLDTLPIRASILACPPPGTGCSKSLANVDAAVGIKKEAGKSTKLVLVRVEEVPKVVFDDNHSHISEPNMGDFHAGSRSDSVPSFNTNYGL